MTLKLLIDDVLDHLEVENVPHKMGHNCERIEMTADEIYLRPDGNGWYVDWRYKGKVVFESETTTSVVTLTRDFYKIREMSQKEINWPVAKLLNEQVYNQVSWATRVCVLGGFDPDPWSNDESLDTADKVIRAASCNRVMVMIDNGHKTMVFTDTSKGAANILAYPFAPAVWFMVAGLDPKVGLDHYSRAQHDRMTAEMSASDEQPF